MTLYFPEEGSSSVKVEHFEVRKEFFTYSFIVKLHSEKEFYNYKSKKYFLTDKVAIRGRFFNRFRRIDKLKDISVLVYSIEDNIILDRAFLSD